MINIVLVVLLILLVRSEFTLANGVFVEKCTNCDHIQHRKGFDEVYIESDDYHYCTKCGMEVQPSDSCCEFYE